MFVKPSHHNFECGRLIVVVVGLPLLFLGMEVWCKQQYRFVPSTELGQGKVAACFKPVVHANCPLVAPPPRRTAIGGYPKVASYDMLGEPLHYFNPVKKG